MAWKVKDQNVIVQEGIQTQMYLFPKSLFFLLNHDVFICLCDTERGKWCRGEDWSDLYLI